VSSYWSPELPSLLARLVVAIHIASFFGWERERSARPAGLRTHILVCMGSTLITLVSQSYARPDSPYGHAEPDRLSAQIVSGIGFLGAGTIIVRGGSVRGLTTAASLWVAAALGIAVGRGGEYIVVAAVTSLIVLFVLTSVDRLEDRLIKTKRWHEVTVTYPIGSGTDGEIIALLNRLKIRLRSIERMEDKAGDHRSTLEIQLTPEQSLDDVNAQLLTIPWIGNVRWERD
jgi:putative Mg2+ transporter-C (MgtC) family protein